MRLSSSDETAVRIEAMRQKIAAIFAFLPPLGVTPALAQTTGGTYWYMHPGWGHMMGWGWFGGFGMLLFWIVIIVLIVLLVRRPVHTHPRPDPLDILKERFARGEIGKEEYEERRKILSG
jgi:putative membrane protein